MTFLDKIASLPRRIQPPRHFLSRARRRREMAEREAAFRRMVEERAEKIRDKKSGGNDK
jgi:hypothetical protein